jgi:hypothetical protein
MAHRAFAPRNRKTENVELAWVICLKFEVGGAADVDHNLGEDGEI